MNWLQLLMLTFYALLGIALVIKVKQINAVPHKAERTTAPEFNDRLKTLACERLAIEREPNSYQKVKAQEQWLKDLNSLLAQASNEQQYDETVIQFKQFRR
jgi:hypothetical protein